MKSFFLIQLFIFSTFHLAFSQRQIQKPNYDEIQEIISKNDQNNYQRLVKRLQENDTTLNGDEYYLLYFAQSLDTSYSPYSQNNKHLYDLLKAGKQQEFASQAKEHLRKNPFDLRIRDYLLDILYESDSIQYNLYAKPFYGFMDAIYLSGEGDNKENPHHVMSVTDEYVFMRYINVAMTQQKLEYPCDVITLAENKLKLKQLFFDVSIPLKKLNSQF